LALWTEIRAITREIKSLDEAWSLPSEIRRWWLEQMMKEDEERAKEIEDLRSRG